MACNISLHNSMFLSASTSLTSSCMLAFRIISSDFSTAILSIQNLVFWMRCLQRSSKGTTRNFCDNKFNLIGKHASNCEGCPAFTACLTNSIGDNGLPQVWTSCSQWSSFSSAAFPNTIGGGKDRSPPPSSLDAFAGWIERSFDPFGNIGLLGASNLISSRHFWYSWKSMKIWPHPCRSLKFDTSLERWGQRRNSTGLWLHTCCSFHLLQWF